MGAALAYYTLFSIALALLIAIAVAGSVFGREASQDQIIGTIQDLVGFQSARNPGDDRKRRTQDSLPTAAGMILLLVGALRGNIQIRA
jgi:membrane protein